MPRPSHIDRTPTRREFLQQAGGGLGALAAAYLLGQENSSAQSASPAPGTDPLQPRVPHLPARARSVIWLFMEGGPSHVDLFDPKPTLTRLAGQPMPESFGRPITSMGTAGNTLMASRRTWRQHGQGGLWISDWYPEVARHADDLCVIRSCWADGLNHVGSVCQMNTGDILAGRPALGAWALYGLGTLNQDLPAFVVMTDDAEVNGGPKNWSSGFLPAVYQGAHFRPDGPPIQNLSAPRGTSRAGQRSQLDFLAGLNRHYGSTRREDTELEARINAYELAFRMQSSAPEAVALDEESDLTRELYGLNHPDTARYGRNCLLARRLVERGVRFIQCYSGSGSGWDAHTELEKNHTKYCRQTDRPIAGLLTDLKARGLLDTTLVIWGGEFGRTPFNEKGTGRDHNPWGFTTWMAGGGVRGGTAIGETDDIGLRAVSERVHVHDLHATILHLLGLNHERLTWPRNGREERATLNDGEIIRKALA